MKLYDLSLVITPNSSEPAPVTVEYISHQEGARILGKPLELQPCDWPDGMAISTEVISLTSHTGTHIDAPLHYGLLCEGLPSKSIEDIPLDWCYQDGVVLRLAFDPTLGPVTESEVRREVARIGYRIKPKDIVLLQTGADRLWGRPEYFTDFRGMTVEATDWLTAQGVKIIGVDCFGFDAPFHRMLAAYSKTRDCSNLWPAHIFGRSHEYCQIERLANLDKLPTQFGFKVACFPIKIKDAGAGWTRVVALYEENE